MIDWNLISKLEGGRRLDGYVPDAEKSHSGVTIATGVDLAQLEEGALPADLRQLLAPYLHVQGMAALQTLHRLPLQITEAQALALEEIASQRILAPLREHLPEFDKLPDAVQTVVASVAYQYGRVWDRCPAFWALVKKNDAAGMIAELRDFGDHYPTRRHQEADYLETHHGGDGRGVRPRVGKSGGAVPVARNAGIA